MAKIETASRVFHPEPFDYAAHNAETARLWEGYHKGSPARVPMILGVNSRVIVLDPRYNPEGVTFAEMFEDPDLLLEVQLRFAWFMRHFLPADREMGPAREWTASVPFMNTVEAEWFGGAAEGIAGDIPDLRPFIGDGDKAAFLRAPLPDPFGGIGAKARRFYDHYLALARAGYAYEGAPLTGVNAPLTGTDGPMTVACAMRGATELCLDFYEDPEFVRDLLAYITEATILRIKAWREYAGIPVPDGFSFADDSIALLSPKLYQEVVFPHHKRLAEELSLGKGPNSIHLCGDATRHFAFLKENLNVDHFDTGYPIDHENMQIELGPGVRMNGGPRVDLLLYGAPQACYDETARILKAVMPHTRRFVLREANNLPPRTPHENIAAMYRAVKELGAYEN